MRAFISFLFKASAIGLAASFLCLFVLSWLVNTGVSLGFACFFGFVNIICMFILKKVGRVEEVAYLSNEVRDHDVHDQQNMVNEEFHDGHH